MLRLCSKITIGQFNFNFVTDVEIESSWQNLTDTARIIIPRKLKWEGKDIVSGSTPLIKRGDKVKIELGYNDKYNTYFEGYISKINPKIPLEIACEDEMWNLKQKTVKPVFLKSGALKDLLSTVGISATAIDANVGEFKIRNATQAQILEHLRKDYNFQSFHRNGKLYVGLAYYPDQQKTIEREFQWNIIDDNLEYKRDDDTKIKVKAISTYPDNKKEEVEVGDPDGDLRTLNFYNVPKDQLKAYAERELPKLKYEGFFGSFETFGDVLVRHGDVISLINKKIPDQNGKYLVKKVTTRFGLDGFRNNIELDRKI